ncbi:hypothetical protein C0Q70_01651 [Pomacea canaliculata]|uniref:Mre11 DNA-binding domain-containing protein n=1 Tax=Pomacea canaliculata TaxID=400727 RepID=A0A2T7Q028_POMCA|nr:hypothetical protein C0Q70_01651 [Pomacea canaliculata]
MGKRPIQFKFLSDQSVNFKHCEFPVVNYNDLNLHISIPVFSIHGNHDEPTGPHSVGSLDILHSSGLLNYFGKTTSLEEIQIPPLLLQKGSTKLALYGLGSLHDESLRQMFLKGNVTLTKPSENKDDWFNLFVLHQNRAKHRETNYIPEIVLPEFLNLPGSSITTALKKGEAKAKCIGLLEVEGRAFEIKPVKLETVRQFYMEDIVLSKTSLDPNDINAVENVEEFCRKKVEQLIAKAGHSYCLLLLEANQLQVLTEDGLGEAVKDFVDKEDKTAISKLVKNQLKESQDHLKNQDQNKNKLEDKEMQSQQGENTFSDDASLDLMMKSFIPEQDYITISEDSFDGEDLCDNIQLVEQNISTTASTCSSNSSSKRGGIFDCNVDEEFPPSQKKWK